MALLNCNKTTDVAEAAEYRLKQKQSPKKLLSKRHRGAVAASEIAATAAEAAPEPRLKIDDAVSIFRAQAENQDPSLRHDNTFFVQLRLTSA